MLDGEVCFRIYNLLSYQHFSCHSLCGTNLLVKFVIYAIFGLPCATNRWEIEC
jgi:hypothetical protein